MLFLKLNCSRKRKHHFLYICVLVMMIPVGLIIRKWTTLTLMRGYFVDTQELACRDVLTNMVRGQWVTRNFNSAELQEIETYRKKILTYQTIPHTLQRKDSRCGNVEFERTVSVNQGAKWFRALCNPDGDSPCCFEHKCVPRPLGSCKCEHCFDMRQQIHAELSTWVPTDPTCKITTFVREQDVCRVLRNTTIYFVGDSLIRQLYIAVLSIVRSNKPYGPLTEKASPSEIKRCDRFYRESKECRYLLKENVRECNNTTTLKFIAYWKVPQTSSIVKTLKKFEGLPNVWFILGGGVHQDFNINIVEQKVIRPILQQVEKSDWPKLIWTSASAPGLLKALKFKNQQTENVIKYNIRIINIMRTKGIPIMEYFNMTNGVMSFDGTHYGPGVNNLKAQIFLNYLLEVRSNITKL